MKVLAISNISNVDDLASDSGVIFQRILAEKFISRGIDYQIVGPESLNFSTLDFSGAKKFCLPIGTNRYSARFGFDWNGFKNLLEKEKPDIIFNNQVEISSAIRSLLVTLNTPDIPIVTYCHYPALWAIDKGVPVIDKSLDHFDLGLSILFNILGALRTSNFFVIQSFFAKNLIEQAALFFKVDYKQDIAVIPPPADPSLLTEKLKRPPQVRNVLYNHRLYESYGTEDFLNYMSEMKDLNFHLVVSDPMPRRSALRSHMSKSPSFFRKRIQSISNAKLVDGNISRMDYKETILSSRLAFAAFRKACVWSMASVDCMGLGVPVLAPDYASYSEFIPSELRFDNMDSAYKLLKRLLDDDAFWLESSKKCLKKIDQLNPDAIAAQFVDLFESALVLT